MGIEFECKAYIPGYFDMTDSSVNSNGNISPYCEEKKATLHHSHKFTILSENGLVHYDKEMIKRTMLVHDATFRKQVYELHRLYRTQRALMAQLELGEFGGYPIYADTLKSRTYASKAPPGDVKRVGQTGTPISGYDLKESSIDFIKETSSQYSVNGASRRYGNTRSVMKMLDLELPADVYANDEDMKILDDKPLQCLPGTDGSVHDGNDRIKLGNSEPKHVKCWATDIHPRQNSDAHVLNKAIEGPSNMKIADSISVGASTQKHDNLTWNLNLLALQGNWREKRAAEASDPNASVAWLQRKQNGTNPSFGQYLSSNSAFNYFNPAPPLFNAAPNSPWQSNNLSHYGISMDPINTPCHQRLKIHGKPQAWKPPPHQNTVKDLDLNDVPADTAATWQDGREPVSSMSYSNNGALISTAAGQDSQCSPSAEHDKHISAPTKCEPDVEMQSPSKEADSSIRNLFDLNEALPTTDDDLEVDPCEPEDGIAPHEPNNDPSEDSFAVTAAENLVAMCNDSSSTQPGSPRLDTLHWFADLATSKENIDGSDDDFEALTLKLDETKSQDLVLPTPRTLEGDSRNDAHCSHASLLVARPRRGKGRGRPPKKKDFQRDILPSLASLPEHQVSEDLRLLGRPKPAAPAKRGGRNGQQKQPRGKRRKSLAAVEVVEEPEVSPPSAPASPPPLAPAADLESDAPLITRWGRTTRRCRRPRCPPANNASLHVA